VLSALGDTKNSLASAVAVQADGKILAVGTAGDHGQTDFLVARYTSTGALDPSFGTAGIALTKLGKNNAAATAIAIQPDGKIVVGGTSGTGFALARYNPAGTLDSGFGTSGTLNTSFGSGGAANVAAALVQPDGKIVAVGTTSDTNGSSTFAVARYTPTGALDSSFGSGGQKVTPAGTGQKVAASCALLLPDGRVIAGGVASDAGKYKIALSAYTAQGAPDPSFGSNGLLLSAVGDGGLAAPGSLLRQSDGKLVVAGTAVEQGNRRFAVVRYLPNGSPDTGFGTAGVVTTQIAEAAYATSGFLTADGKLVAAGSAQEGAALKVALARYLLG
jgi:uncharacterized delta-60 repeat protein